MLTSTLKRASLSLTHSLGVSRRVASSAWRRERLLILCYHGVSLDDEHEWNPELYVPQPLLARRMEILARNRCHVLSLDEALARIARNDLPDRAVAITFDDGYVDFKRRAWPVLQAHGYPATVYLTTMRCEHNFPIVNLLLSYVLWKRRDRTLDGSGLPGLEATTYPLATASQRARVVELVDGSAQRLKLSRADKDRAAAQVTARLAFEYDALAASRLLTIMSPAEVAEMSSSGVSIELHTHRHYTPDDPELFRHEIVENRRQIEAMTGKRPRHFCYPSGCYRPSYLPILEREGVVSATTCEPGLVTRDSNPLVWPRFVDTSGVSDLEFEGWVQGTASWLARTPAAASL